jgi:hypothetical protein
MSIVDDYGRYDARSSILRSSLYPLKIDKVSVPDIVKWMGECSEAGLVRCYQVGGKDYLELQKFGQRLRAMKSKFPEPSDTVRHSLSTDSKLRLETETETDSESEFETEADISPTKKNVSWNSKPGDAEMELVLPDVKQGAVIELFGITKNTKVSPAQVQVFWRIFKQQNFAGEKYYQSPNQAFSHFINWCKTQDVKNISADPGAVSSKEKDSKQKLRSLYNPE